MRILRPIALGLLLLVVAGCASAGTRGYIAAKVADMADKSLETSVWGVCKATSIGAVMRRYGSSVKTMAVYTAFCFLTKHAPVPLSKAAEEVTPPTIAPSPASTE